jgi:hypothetical protein
VGLVAERKRVFVEQRYGSVEAAFAAAQPCSLHGCSVGAEDVSGTSGLRIGPACMGRRTVAPSPDCWCMSAPHPAHTCYVAARGSKSFENVVAG